VGPKRRGGSVRGRGGDHSGKRERDLPSNTLLRYLIRYLTLSSVPVDRVGREGELVAAGFRVVAAPGHTLGHTSLLRDEDGLLSTGDAFGVYYAGYG
jgi:glyoxylase-like metal-dependent hydrolase (beta-lactamase superfamily II)